MVVGPRRYRRPAPTGSESGVKAVPMLVAVIGGQLAPLAQGTIDEQQFRQLTEQVIQAATSAGMVGRAEPVMVEVSSEEPVGPDPRTVEAEKLMDAGKFDEAVAAYDALLASEPNDPVLIAGRNGAALLGRLDGKDPAALLTAAQQRPDDVDAQLAAADVELMGGRPADAFNRIIQVVRSTHDEERETARTRLLDLLRWSDNLPRGCRSSPFVGGRAVLRFAWFGVRVSWRTGKSSDQFI